MVIVKEHKPRKYSAVSHDGGIVLCDSESGAFLLLRFPEDIERLKELLDTLEIIRVS